MISIWFDNAMLPATPFNGSRVVIAQLLGRRGNFLIAALVGGWVLFPAPTSAHTQQQVQCQNKSGAYSIEQRIAACTAIIQSERNRTNLSLSHFYRGNAYSKKGDLDRAIEDYTEAIRLDSSDEAFFFNRGNQYRRKGDLDHAVADFSQSINLNPKSALAFNNRAETYIAIGNYERAIVDSNQAILLDAQSAHTYFLHGLAVYLHTGDDEQAIANFNQAMKLDPKFSAAYLDRGNVYENRGEFDRAIADYDRTIALDPKSLDALMHRGSVYLNMGNFDRAIADANQAIEVDTKSASAYFLRGRANLYSGASDKALADTNQASELDSKSAYLALWLDILNKRSHLTSRLPDAVKQLDMSKWPAPIVRLYLNQLTPEAVIAATDDADPKTKKNQICEFNFYSGELLLQQRGKEEAVPQFRLAVANCSKSFIEYGGARAELKALGASP